MEYGTAHFGPGAERWLALSRRAPPQDQSVHPCLTYYTSLDVGRPLERRHDVQHPHLRGAVAVRAVAGGGTMTGMTQREPAHVTVRRAAPGAWRQALIAADGDVGRLTILDDGSVLVTNTSRNRRTHR